MSQHTFIEHPEWTEKIIQQIPFARFINFRIGQDKEGNFLFCLPFSEQNIGNTLIASIHGGLTGGMLETASVVLYCLNNPDAPPPKVIDFSLDYLRAGKLENIFVYCELIKQGKRIANVTAKAWQESPDIPIAIARTHLLLQQDEAV